MKIFGIILFIVGLLNLSLCYFAAKDRIKPSKFSQITYYIIVSIFLFSAGLRALSRK